MAYVYTVNEFIDRLKDVEKHKTIYSLGTFGWVCNPPNIERTKKAHSFNRTPAQLKVYDSADKETFMFDCIGLVKGVAGGWCGNVNRVYGGATYNSDHTLGDEHLVVDTDAKKMLNYCIDVTSDFSSIIAGEYLWMDGHCGVYVGDGLVIECTPKWKGGVQYSYLGNIGCTQGKSRIWEKHGKLIYIDYGADLPKNPNAAKEEIYHICTKGDNLTKIAKMYNTTLAKIKELNPNIKPPKYVIYVGQKVRVK